MFIIHFFWTVVRMELNKYAPASELCTAMLELKVWVLENMA
jgi:hypothetical protein